MLAVTNFNKVKKNNNNKIKKTSNWIISMLNLQEGLNYKEFVRDKVPQSL